MTSPISQIQGLNSSFLEKDIRQFLEIPKECDLSTRVVIRCWRALPADAPQLAELARRFNLLNEEGQPLRAKLEVGAAAMEKLFDLEALGLTALSAPKDIDQLPRAVSLYCLGNSLERLSGAEKMNALHIAAMDQSFDQGQLKALCRLPVDLLVQDSNGQNALQIACNIGNMAFVNAFLSELGTDWKDAQQRTVLHYAAESSAQRTFPAVLENVKGQKELLNQLSLEGESALGSVLDQRSLSRALQLMDAGADQLGTFNLPGLATDLPRLLYCGDRELSTEFVNSLDDLLAGHPDRQVFLDTLLIAIARYAKAGIEDTRRLEGEGDAKKNLRGYLTLLTEVVLAYGADAQAKDRDGRTARSLWAECRSGSKDVKRLLKGRAK